LKRGLRTADIGLPGHPEKTDWLHQATRACSVSATTSLGWANATIAQQVLTRSLLD